MYAIIFKQLMLSYLTLNEPGGILFAMLTFFIDTYTVQAVFLLSRENCTCQYKASTYLLVYYAYDLYIFLIFNFYIDSKYVLCTLGVYEVSASGR